VTYNRTKDKEERPRSSISGLTKKKKKKKKKHL